MGSGELVLGQLVVDRGSPVLDLTGLGRSGVLQVLGPAHRLLQALGPERDRGPLIRRLRLTAACGADLRGHRLRSSWP